MRSAPYLAALLLLVTVKAHAQDEAGSRDIKLSDPAARTLTINQIETSKFPNIDIFALVTEHDQPVTGLTEADFKIREDEVVQEPIKVAAHVEPLSVVLAVDTSGSMSKAIAKTREAASTFVNTLGAQDTVAVLSFNRTVQVLAPLGTSKDVAKQTISGLQARGDTALFDALYASLEAAKNRPGRRAAVVLSDGVDDDGQGNVLSKRNLAEVIALAKESNIPVFTIGLGSEIDETTLKKVAAESGGAYFSALSGEELQTLYEKLGKQLTGQYHISYTSNLPGDGSVHNIQLLHTSLRGVKAYTSPKTGSTVAAVKPTPIPAPVSIDNGVTEVIGSTAPENAPTIPLGRKIHVKNPRPDGKWALKMYVAVELDTATYASAVATTKRISGGECPKMNWATPSLSEGSSVYECTNDVTLTVFTSTRSDTAGKWYVVMEQSPDVDLGVYPNAIGDAGTGRDAGSAEAAALPLTEGASVSGIIRRDWDDVDAYRATFRAGTEYQVRVRPDLTCTAVVEIFDEDGVRISKGESQNEGAGVTLVFTPKSDMTALVAVRKYASGDYNFHGYTIVYGPKGIAAPQQPSSPQFKNVLPESR